MPSEPQHIKYAELPREHLFDGTFQRCAARSDGALVTFNWMSSSLEPQERHSHPFDQLSIIVEGAMDFDIDGEHFVVSKGEALLIPADAPHTSMPLGDEICLNIDVFGPPRPDYLYMTAHQGDDFPD